MACKKNWLLNQINLSIEPGECVTIMGPSGAGKTILLNIIGGGGVGARKGSSRGDVGIAQRTQRFPCCSNFSPGNKE